MSFLSKLQGDGAALPPQPSLKSAALAWIGGFLAIASVALVYNNATREARYPKYG